jgi:hypothetical protein
MAVPGAHGPEWVVVGACDRGAMGGPLRLRVPAENFAVPLHEVSVQFDEAIRLWHACRPHRYFAGVYEAFRWLAVLTNVRPVSRDEVIAAPQTIQEELVRAGSVAGGIPYPGAPIGRIHPEWALGVERVLMWASGNSTNCRPPLPWPGGKPPAVMR